MKPKSPDEKPGAHEPVSGQSIELEWEAAWRDLIGALRRHRRVFFIVFGCIVIGSIGYGFTTTRLYTASAYVSIDARHNEPISERHTSEPASVVGSAEVDSQVEVIKSARIATNVVRKLELHKSPEFVSREPAFDPIAWTRKRLNSAISWLFKDDNTEKKDDEKDSILERRVVEQFGKRLSVARAGLTYVVEINFTAKDPKLAATIANAVSEAYIAEQLEARYGTLRRANAWLFERIKALRQRQIESERAVADFRAQNNIVDTGGVNSRTVSDQQLGELTTNVTTVRNQTAEAFAKWQQLQHVVNAGDIDAPGLTDAAHNPVIQRLQEQLGELVRRRADRISRVGPGHGVIVLLNSEINQVRQLILSELRTIEGSVRNEYEIAKHREEAITQKLNAAIGENTKANMSSVQLRDLQREADANRSLYEAFLSRYASASEQQNFPISEARILSEATSPLDPSHPKKVMISHHGSDGWRRTWLGLRPDQGPHGGRLPLSPSGAIANRHPPHRGDAPHVSPNASPRQERSPQGVPDQPARGIARKQANPAIKSHDAHRRGLRLVPLRRRASFRAVRDRKGDARRRRPDHRHRFQHTP